MQLDLSRFSPAERSTLQLRVLYEGAGYRKFRCSHFEEYSLYQQNERFLSDSLGEGETVYDELLDAYKENKKRGGTRKEFLEMAAEIEGIYVPAFYDVTYKED